MADVLKQVKALIALSASDSKGEAQNAAVKACRLIREHGFIVDVPKTSQEQAASVRSWQAAVDAVRKYVPSEVREVATEVASKAFNSFLRDMMLGKAPRR